MEYSLELPNSFFVMGPGSGLGHSSVIYVSECQMTYVISAIRKLVEANLVDEDVKSV